MSGWRPFVFVKQNQALRRNRAPGNPHRPGEPASTWPILPPPRELPGAGVSCARRRVSHGAHRSPSRLATADPLLWPATSLLGPPSRSPTDVPLSRLEARSPITGTTSRCRQDCAHLEALPASALPTSAACGPSLRSWPLWSCGPTLHQGHISPGVSRTRTRGIALCAILIIQDGLSSQNLQLIPSAKPFLHIQGHTDRFQGSGHRQHCVANSQCTAGRMALRGAHFSSMP